MKFHVTIFGKQTRDYDLDVPNRLVAVANASEQFLEDVYGRPQYIDDHFEEVEWDEITAGRYENDFGWESDEGEKLEGKLTALVTPMGD